MTASDINVIALSRGSERFVWLYRNEQLGDVLRSFGKFASDPELSFTWWDAATLSKRARSQVAEDQPYRGTGMSE